VRNLGSTLHRPLYPPNPRQTTSRADTERTTAFCGTGFEAWPNRSRSSQYRSSKLLWFRGGTRAVGHVVSTSCAAKNIDVAGSNLVGYATAVDKCDRIRLRASKQSLWGGLLREPGDDFLAVVVIPAFWRKSWEFGNGRPQRNFLLERIGTKTAPHMNQPSF
jgi:hypothetical protein